jgi:hypothetical protein
MSLKAAKVARRLSEGGVMSLENKLAQLEALHGVGPELWLTCDDDSFEMPAGHYRRAAHHDTEVLSPADFEKYRHEHLVQVIKILHDGVPHRRMAKSP